MSKNTLAIFKVSAAAILLLCFFGVEPWLLRVNAIEVSLEENKFEKGGIGFVDMHVLFKQFPQTEKAKLEFEDAMHQTEEQINLRRAEIIGLKAEIARLQAERDFIVKTSSAPLVNNALTQGAKTSTTPVETARPGVPGVVSASSYTVPSPSSNIPGIFNPAQAQPSNPSALPGSASAASPLPAAGLQSRVGLSGPFQNIPGVTTTASPAAAPGAAAPAAPQALPPMTARLQELDRMLADKQKILSTKETDFKAFEDQAEKTLLDLESRKTEVLLGRIYGAIQEVAKNENISVVVDKSQILFGHRAVDLTDKVLKKLKSQ